MSLNKTDLFRWTANFFKFSDSKIYSRLNARNEQLKIDIRSFIIRQLIKNKRKISFVPDLKNEEYPTSCTLWGKHNNPLINITDVYINNDNNIYADGVGDDGQERKGFKIYPEQYLDVFYFIKAVTKL